MGTRHVNLRKAVHVAIFDRLSAPCSLPHRYQSCTHQIPCMFKAKWSSSKPVRLPSSSMAPTQLMVISNQTRRRLDHDSGLDIKKYSTWSNTNFCTRTEPCLVALIYPRTYYKYSISGYCKIIRQTIPQHVRRLSSVRIAEKLSGLMHHFRLIFSSQTTIKIADQLN